MKFFKFLLCFTLCFFLSATVSFAKDFEIMYSVKSSKSADVKYIADFYSRQKNMYFVSSKQNYTYVNPAKNSSDYYVMIFSQIGENTDFYFFSNIDKSDTVKEILKRFKSKNLKYSKIKTNETLASKRKQAVRICNDIKNDTTQTATNLVNNSNIYTPSSNYDFSDLAQQKYDNSYSPYINTDSVTPQIHNDINNTKTNIADKIINPPKNVVQGQISQNAVNGQTPQKTTTAGNSKINVTVELQSSINSQSLDQNDLISAVLKDDLYVNNQLKAEKGSIVYGNATNAQKAGRGYKDGSITLTFNRILTTEGEEIYISSVPMQFAGKNSNRGAKISGAMLGGILTGVAGAALGSLFSSKNNWAVNLSAGAITGAIGGGFVVLSANGEEIELTEGSNLTLQINSVQ